MHWLPQQLCAVLVAFPAQQSLWSEQPFVPAAVEHFSSQHPAEAAVFAQLLPSFPLQQEASSFPEQQEATSVPSFEPDFACMQASMCLWDAAVVPVVALSQHEHFVSEDALSGDDGAGVAVCAQEAIARIRTKAINLNFMTCISVYESFRERYPYARSCIVITPSRKAQRVV
jgi:hypothetical protein